MTPIRGLHNNESNQTGSKQGAKEDDAVAYQPYVEAQKRFYGALNNLTSSGQLTEINANIETKADKLSETLKRKNSDTFYKEKSDSDEAEVD